MTMLSKRRLKFMLEMLFLALLLTLLERQYLQTNSSDEPKTEEEFETLAVDGDIIPTAAPSSISPHPVIPRRTLLVKALGLGPNSWYYGALKGTFNMCYKHNYIDPSMQCAYLRSDQDITKADAVVFRGTQLRHPISQRIINGSVKARLPHQWFVFWDNEPPYKVWKYANLSNYNSVFNLTATYSPDSDVPRVDMRRFRHCVRNEETYKTLESVDFAAKKRSGAVVAWFASECITQSKRERYVKELQKYIAVDIYGECGPLKCGSRELGTWSKDRCHERLLHNDNSYKFYLAFENSFCKDYVTEKLWMLLKFDIVPIVMGAVDYGNMLPKGSYIDVKDFSSPRALARYLHYLNRRKKQYNSYIANKNSLDCYLTYPFMPWECKLCEKLHQLQGSKRIVYDLARFWGSRRCHTPDYYFRNVQDHNFEL